MNQLCRKTIYLCKEETGSCTDKNIWFPVKTCPLITHNLSLLQGGIHTQTQLKTCWFPSMPCSHSWPPSVTLSLDSPLLPTSTHLNPPYTSQLPSLSTSWTVNVTQEWLTGNISTDGKKKGLSIRRLTAANSICTQSHPLNKLAQVAFESVRWLWPDKTMKAGALQSWESSEKAKWEW